MADVKFLWTVSCNYGKGILIKTSLKGHLEKPEFMRGWTISIAYSTHVWGKKIIRTTLSDCVGKILFIKISAKTGPIQVQRIRLVHPKRK
jgi:hypothetical protein